MGGNKDASQRTQRLLCVLSSKRWAPANVYKRTATRRVPVQVRVPLLECPSAPSAPHHTRERARKFGKTLGLNQEQSRPVAQSRFGFWFRVSSQLVSSSTRPGTACRFYSGLETAQTKWTNQLWAKSHQSHASLGITLCTLAQYFWILVAP